MSIWRTCELGSVVTLKRGYDLPKQNRMPGTVPVYSSSGVTGFHNQAMVTAPGVITGRYGTIGQVFYAEVDYWPLNTTLYVEDFHGNDPRFIYYFLKTIQWEKYQSASAVPGINRNTVHTETVSIPDYKTQLQIAHLLSMFDKKISCNERMTRNLEQLIMLYFSKQFTYKEGDILPDGWKWTTLGEVAYITNNIFNPLKNDRILLEHYSIPAYDEAKFPVFEWSTEIKSNKFIVDDGCFMISKLNPDTKRTWRPYCLTKNAVCSSEFIVYKAKNPTHTDYLFTVIDSIPFSDYMCSHVTGSTGSRQRTTPSDTLNYILAYPSEKAIDTFTETVKPMYKAIRENAIENNRLIKLRNTLLARIMLGEIDVSGIAL